MGRVPLDTIPQRVLVYDLKRAIDLIPRDPNARGRVRRLVAENPRSARSTHVLKNLGRDRVATLAYILQEPLRVPARGGFFPRPEITADGSSSPPEGVPWE